MFLNAEDTETTCNISKSIKEDDEDTEKNIGLGSNSNDAPLLCHCHTWLLNYSSINVEEISALYESEQFAIFQPAENKTTILPLPFPPISFLWFIIAKTFFKNVCLYQESFCRSKELRVSKILTISSLERSQKNLLCESFLKIDLIKMLEIHFLLYQKVRFK